MHNQSKSSRGKSVVLGALLLLAATASGCGVGLPTQPDIDSDTVHQRSTGAAGALVGGTDLEFGDPNVSGGSGEDAPAGEIVIPSPSRYDNFRGRGFAHGHLKNKWK
ncbi:MAG: hypothetical protein ACRENJ_04340 [Candidatus Eiseniibacteriota bacterium]